MWFLGRSLEDQLGNHVGAHESFMVPTSERRFDLGYDLASDLNDDASLHDLAVIHHLLAKKVAKKNGKPATESSEGSSPSNWLKQGACLASNCGMEGHVCGTGHCVNTLSEQHSQLAKL